MRSAVYEAFLALFWKQLNKFAGIKPVLFDKQEKNHQ
jgi:hypothetical protein